MKVSPMSQAKVERSVTVNNDMSWHLHFAGRLVEISANNVLKELPLHINKLKDLQDIVHCVERAHVCPGNPQTDFVEVVSKRGGATTGKNGRTVAFVDCVGEVTDVVRTTECKLLCTPKSAVSIRCKSCRQYRAQLHANKSRDQQAVSSGRIAHDSHCNFRYLSQSGSMQRFKSLQKQRKMLNTKISRLEEERKACEVIENDGVKLTEEDGADIQAVLKDKSIKVEKHFAKDSLQYILWEQQVKYNHLTNKRQMRWHPLIIRFALSLRYASSAAYRTVASTGLLSLPSERTLHDYTHWCSVQNGVILPFIQKAKRVMAQQGFQKVDYQFASIMDELKIKSGLVYRKHTRELSFISANIYYHQNITSHNTPLTH